MLPVLAIDDTNQTDLVEHNMMTNKILTSCLNRCHLAMNYYPSFLNLSAYLEIPVTRDFAESPSSSSGPRYCTNESKMEAPCSSACWHGRLSFTFTCYLLFNRLLHGSGSGNI